MEVNVSFKEKVDENADCRFKSLRLGCGSLRVGEDVETRLEQLRLSLDVERLS